MGEIVLTIGTDGYGETTIFYLQYLKEISKILAKKTREQLDGVICWKKPFIFLPTVSKKLARY